LRTFKNAQDVVITHSERLRRALKIFALLLEIVVRNKSSAKNAITS